MAKHIGIPRPNPASNKPRTVETAQTSQPLCNVLGGASEWWRDKP